MKTLLLIASTSTAVLYLAIALMQHHAAPGAPTFDSAPRSRPAGLAKLSLISAKDRSINGWQDRIAGVNIPGGAASVLSFQSFDVFPVKNMQQFVHNNSGNPSAISTDCTVAADGCSLKFWVQKGYPEGTPGWFDWNFSSDLSRTFGEGQEFYVQYRERLDPGMLNGANFPGGSFKSDIITEGDSPRVIANACSNSPGEVVMQQTSPGGAHPWIYHNCGYAGGHGTKFAFMQGGYQAIQLGGIVSSNFLDQDAAGCPHYNGRGIPSSDPTCWNYVANEWFTVQVHVRIGVFNQPTSIIDFWLAHEGQPAQLVTNVADAALVNDGTGKATGKYGKIQLNMYMLDIPTGFRASTGVWFDDLIASTRRIADPGVSTPNAPDNLTLTHAERKQVTVNWRVNSHNGTAQDDTGFLIERCTGDQTVCFPNPQTAFKQIATTMAGANSFVDATVVSGGTYTYRVRAKNSVGKSAYTAAICFNGGTTCGATVTVP